eukprot:g47721.t1
MKPSLPSSASPRIEKDSQIRRLAAMQLKIKGKHLNTPWHNPTNSFICFGTSFTCQWPVSVSYFVSVKLSAMSHICGSGFQLE